MTASASERPPPLTSSSSTESKAPESDSPPSMVGVSSRWRSGEMPSASYQV
jgi:hypothetical protein